MAIIPQISLFRWQDDIDRLGDLERLKLVFDNLPDEERVRIQKNEETDGMMILCVLCGTALWLALSFSIQPLLR